MSQSKSKAITTVQTSQTDQAEKENPDGKIGDVSAVEPLANPPSTGQEQAFETSKTDQSQTQTNATSKHERRPRGSLFHSKSDFDSVKVWNGRVQNRVLLEDYFDSCESKIITGNGVLWEGEVTNPTTPSEHWGTIWWDEVNVQDSTSISANHSDPTIWDNEVTKHQSLNSVFTNSMEPISSYACSSTDREQNSEGHDSQLKTPTGDEIVQETCPDCGSRIRKGVNDQYCENCGLLVSDDKIDTGPEWRAYDSQETKKRSRVGSPSSNSIHDKGLSTTIGHRDVDANGNPLDAKAKVRMSRLRKWNERFQVKNAKERNLRKALGEIRRLSSELNLPEYAEETASTVYRRAWEEELTPGRPMEAMAAGSVYIAIRQAGLPKTIKQLDKYSRVEKNRVTGAFFYIARQLEIELKPPKIGQYLSGVASEMGASIEVENKAKELLQTSIDKNLHSGKAPAGMAAAAIYAATMLTDDENTTQKKASEAGDVCEITIRNRYRELLEAADYDPEDPTAASKTTVKSSA